MTASPTSHAAVCPGDPDAFASEMIKLINDKEFRSAKTRIASWEILYKCSNCSCLFSLLFLLQ